MTRTQLLRVVLPGVLLLLIAVLVVTLRPRPGALDSTPQVATPGSGPLAEGIEVSELWAGQRRFFLRAGIGHLDREGRLQVEKVERVEVAREKQPPLVLKADRGTVDGQAGDRVLLLEGGVEIQDETSGLKLEIPSVKLSESEGEARSLGAVKFGGPGYEGDSRSVVYGLDEGEPMVLDHPKIEDAQGATAAADQAIAVKGARDIELRGHVHVVRGPTVVDGDNIRLLRDEQDRLRSADGTGGIRCTGFPISQGAASLRALRMRVDWNEAGDPSAVVATGAVELATAEQSLTADSIQVNRGDASAGFRLEAAGSVRSVGKAEGLPAELTTDTLAGALGADGKLRTAEAVGRVRFKARGATGEGARGTFDATRTGREAMLYAGPGAPARLARDRTRVAAQTIATDLRGTQIYAEGRVESTLLGAARGGALFEAEQAIHFISAKLSGETQGNRLTFEGNVRGWQGERSLSAERVEVDQTHDSLKGSGAVASRFPLDDKAAATRQYVQVTSNTLDYSGAARKIVYEGKTRALQGDGSIEGDTLEVLLDDAGKHATEIRVTGTVRFEMTPAESSADKTPVRGSGDRAVYTIPDRTLRLFGDTAPASVTRSGENGGTTTGRVLRYRLDAGTLEVESSGESAPGIGNGSGDRHQRSSVPLPSGSLR